MKKFFGFVLLLFVAWIGVMVVSDHLTTYPFRYKQTVEVNTPDGVKSGFSIVEATYFREMFIQSVFGPRFPTRFQGEAVFVDLGSGRNVVLTVMDLPEYLPVRAFKFPWGLADAYNEMRDAVEQANQAGPQAAPLERIPMMVTFRDTANPKSIERVDNLSAAFGPGYSLNAITLEATDEPITEDIGKTLPWFQKLWHDPKLKGHGLDGTYFGYSADPFMIGTHYLKREK